MRNHIKCSVCGREYAEDEVILFDDEYLCETCLEEETVVCSDCGTRIWNEQDAGSSELHLCQRCFDRGYTTCERCGAVVSYDDAFYRDDEDDYPYCESCYNQLKCRAIHDYGYRPEPIFYGTPPRYFGVELEIDGAGELSRSAFGESVLEQEASIARLLFFVEKNWNELLKFSRRTNRQLERWAARYGYKDTPKEMMDQAKNHRLGRYTCVNLTNANTIEIRIFRGTLKYNTFLATLQLVNRLCDVAIFMSDAELHAMSWSDFTAGITEPELIQYLKERRLYLNEPVESEAEV